MKSMSKVTVRTIIYITIFIQLGITVSYSLAMPGSTDTPSEEPSSDTTPQQHIADTTTATSTTTDIKDQAVDSSLTETSTIPSTSVTLTTTQQISPSKAEASESLDTTDYPEEVIGSHGNWIKKVHWLKRSYEVNQKIQDIALKVQEARSIYTNKSITINETLNTFYKSSGIEQGQLDQLFSSIEAYLNKQLKQSNSELAQNYENARVKQVKITNITLFIKEQRNKLAQLKLDLQSLIDLDRSLDDRLKKVDESIASSNALSREVLERLKVLWHIIDDKKAAAVYYEIEGTSLVKINAINTYLTTTLLQDFDKVLNVITTQITKIQSSIQSSEEEGLIIKNRSKQLQEIKKQKELKKKNTDGNSAQKKSLGKNVSWYDSLYKQCTTLYEKIYTYVTSYVIPKKKNLITSHLVTTTHSTAHTATAITTTTAQATAPLELVTTQTLK